MIEKQEISSLMKAVAGVVREYVDGKADPLGARLAGLESRLEEVSKPDRFKSYLEDSFDAARKENGVFGDKLGGIEKRLDATNAAIGEAVEPFAVRLTGIEAKAEEAANTERFRPFLETALDAVRKESGTVDEKLGEIEKRLEGRAADTLYGAVAPLEIQVGVLLRDIENVSKRIPADQSENVTKALGCLTALETKLDDLQRHSVEGVTRTDSVAEQVAGLHRSITAVEKLIPPDPAETIQKLVENIGATVVRLDGCETQIESLSALSAGIDPLDLKLAGLTERVEKVALSIPADTTESVSTARAEISAVGKRIDGIEPRLEGLAKTAAEVTPITERVIRLETRYEDVRRDAIDAGISKAIEDFAGKEVKPLDDKIGTLEARLEDITKSAEAINPLTNQIEDLSARFNEIGAANDALQERILKSVDVQIVEAVKQLPPPKDGEHGKDGISAYQIAVSKGFSGSEDEWLGSLKGINGIKGDAGESIAGPRGEPGKDSEPVDVALIIKEVVAQIPVPKDGKDGKDAEPISEELVRSEVEKAVAEIPKPKEIPPEVVAEMVSVEVQKAVSAIPKPKDGQDGLAGKDAEPVDVEKIVADVVARVPVPKDGERGPAGESIVGPKGEPGDRGEKGESIAGEAGTKGEAGPSAYQLALEEGFAGTRSQWLASLQGKNGDAGRDGKDGRDAREPRDGKDGEPGRDALHIEVLPTIDTSKSVPRGTFASHNGGLWRAARNTDAGDDLHLCGWQSIVEGFPEIEIDQGDDLRTFTFRAVSSTGRKIEKRFSLPVVIDRGVYKVDRWYEPGDSVSQRGCGWIAQRKTQSVPGTNDDWRMSVKAGRDGKDVALLSPKPPQQVRLK